MSSDTNSLECIRSLEGIEGKINFVKLCKDYLFFARKDHTIEIRNPLTFQLIGILQFQEDIKSITMHGDMLFIGWYSNKKSYINLTFWNLSQAFTLDILDANLNLLGKMAYKVHRNLGALIPLEQKLHPHFQKDLKKICEEMGSPTFCLEGILAVQTKICLEVLLYEIHKENWERVPYLIQQLKFINKNYSNRLFELLSKVSSPMTSNLTWGEDAFFRRNGCEATPYQMKEVIQTLKKELPLGGFSVPLLLASSAAISEELPKRRYADRYTEGGRSFPFTFRNC